MFKNVDGLRVEMTQEEIDAFNLMRTEWANSDNTLLLKIQTQAALDKSDMVAIRCFKAGIEFPDAWKAYVTALRQVINTGTGLIPEMPAYPN